MSEYLSQYRSTSISKIIFGFRPKLDGVGPVDTRPSTDKLHHFVRGKKCDVTHDMRHVWGGEHSLKISAP